jgi:hypothetical protein
MVLRFRSLVRSDGEVIDGHLRLKAARKLGLAQTPVFLCDEWTPAQVKAFRLMVNRSATWADWDEDLNEIAMRLFSTRIITPEVASEQISALCERCLIPRISPRLFEALANLKVLSYTSRAAQRRFWALFGTYILRFECLTTTRAGSFNPIRPRCFATTGHLTSVENG